MVQPVTPILFFAESGPLDIPAQSWLAFGWTWGLFALNWAIRVLLGLRVITRRLPVSIMLAWLSIIFVAPLVGLFLYFLLGEQRLGSRRLKRFRDVSRHLDEAAANVWTHKFEVSGAGTVGSMEQAVARLNTAVGGLPPMAGNQVELLADCDQMLDRMIADIDRAQHHVHILTYIWQTDGRGVRVAQAVARAARRGVQCRVLVDGAGGRGFFKSDLPQVMRETGVQVVEALPVNALRALLSRVDMRNHRKLTIIDGKIGYCGSQNITDRNFQSRHILKFGPWIDATALVRGPAVAAMQLVFLRDWLLDSKEPIREPGEYLSAADAPPSLDLPGTSVIQVFPSEPGFGSDPGSAGASVGIREGLVVALCHAREEIIITTPYFAPDDATMMALRSAALRGVSVTIMMPSRSDNRLVAAAARSNYLDLLDAGARIYEYPNGLLHSKIVTVDRTLAVLGSANLDMRSFWLNFEVTLVFFDDDFSRQIRFLQTSYMNNAVQIDRETWKARPRSRALIEQAARVFSPLL